MKQIKRNPDVPSYWLSIFEHDTIIKLFNFVEVMYEFNYGELIINDCVDSVFATFLL